MAAIEAPTIKRQASSVEEAVKHELKSGGWEPGIGKGGTIWRNPIEAHRYDELKALAILKGGLDAGDSSWSQGVAPPQVPLASSLVPSSRGRVAPGGPEGNSSPSVEFRDEENTPPGV